MRAVQGNNSVKRSDLSQRPSLSGDLLCAVVEYLYEISDIKNFMKISGVSRRSAIYCVRELKIEIGPIDANEIDQFKNLKSVHVPIMRMPRTLEDSFIGRRPFGAPRNWW